MNMQTNPTGVAIKQDTPTAVPQDHSLSQVRRNVSLDALEQEIKELEAQHSDNMADQAGTQNGTSTTQNLSQNPTNPSDGAATSMEQVVATSGKDLTYREEKALTKKHYDKNITDARNLIKHLEEKLANVENPSQVPQPVIDNNNNSNAQTRVQELENELAATRQEKAVGEVVKKHDDFYDIVSSQEWADWKETQPQNIQAMITGNTDDSISMIRALDLYKFDKGTSTLQAQTQDNTIQPNMNSAADAVTGTQSTSVNSTGQSNKRIWTRSEISSMSINEYERLSDQILLAQAEGRIQDDTKRPY